MKKKLFPMIILLCALLLVVAVSCNSSPKKDPVVPSDPTEPARPATLTLSYFRENYRKGADKPEGKLYYTDTKGKITTLSLQSEGVTTDFDATTVGENKTLKVTYKDIECAATYSVFEPEKVDINGAFIVGEKTILFFKTKDDGTLTIDKEVWKNWKVYSEFDYTPENVTQTDNLPYTIDLSSSGETIIKVDDWQYRPDGKGGIRSYKSEDDFLDPANGYVPNTSKFYVSTSTAGRGTPDTIKTKYLVIAFSDGIASYQDMYMWFVDNTAAETLATLTKANAAIIVDASKFSFGQAGVELPKTEGEATEGKELSRNLKVYSREGYDKFSIVSYCDETNYKGYSYTMNLSAVAIPEGFWL